LAYFNIKKRKEFLWKAYEILLENSNYFWLLLLNSVFKMTIFTFTPKINIFAFLNEIFSLLHSSLKLKFIKTHHYILIAIVFVLFFKINEAK
jgi:hypothetical protein